MSSSAPVSVEQLAIIRRRLLAHPLLRFGAVGGVVTVFFMGLNALLSRAFGLSQNLAFLAAYPPALLLHFTLNKLWTFRDARTVTGRHVAEYFYSVVVTFVIQWPSFQVLHGALRLPGWLAAGGANVLQMAASYAMLRWRVFNDTGTNRDASTARDSWHRLVLLLCVLSTSALLAWTALGRWSLPPLHRAENDYYNLLVAGFRKGSLAMDVPVADELRSLTNPYDPVQRAHVPYLHDASLFRGRYYLYFGVVPAVVLFWPFKAVTGMALPFVAAVVAFLLGANWITAWLWLRILRDRFPSAGLGAKVLGVVALGLCGGQLVLARRASLWELPISAGHFFFIASMGAAYLALASSHSRRWLAMSGLGLGLAVGCRPTLAAGGAGLAVLVIVAGFRGSGSLRSKISRTLVNGVVAGLPLAAVLAGLLAYNYERFRDPFEFGIRYQLNTNNEFSARHFRPDFIPFNFRAYFLSVPRVGRYFPFIHQPELGTLPPGYYGTEFVYGAFWVCPVILWLVFTWRALRRRDLGEISGFISVIAASAFAITSVLLCFDTAAARYTVDFLPLWVWLGFLGWACLQHGRVGWQRLALTGGLFVTSLLTIFATVVLSISIHSIMEFNDPHTYIGIARAFNLPTACWERLTGQRQGALEMDVRFPAAPSGSLEPLVVTGVGYESDYFFAFYGSDHTVQLGFESTGDSMLLSKAIKYDPERVYHLSFQSGSLFPPEGHPAYLGWNEAGLRSLLNWVRIDFDGKAIINQNRQSHEGSPEFLQVGRDSRSAAFGKRFSGNITNVHRRPLREKVPDPDQPGDIVLDVSLPTEVIDSPQPLVVVGRTGRSEAIAYRTLDANHFALCYEYWGAGMVQSPTFALPVNRDVRFRIRLGSRIQPDATNPYSGRYKFDVIVWMNGKPIWWRKSPGPLDPHPEVAILANMIGSSAMRPSFDGILREESHVPVPAWKRGPFGALELYVVGRGTGVQPLVATGHTGRADTLAIEWLPRGKARLVYDHWGFPLFVGQTFEWSEDGMHSLVVRLPAFRSLDRSIQGDGEDQLSVTFDGKVVADGKARFYDAPSNTLIFGANSAGSSVAGNSLDLALADIRQID